ncbi:MAG: ABC transporter ATP-binding protein [bacterium]
MNSTVDYFKWLWKYMRNYKGLFVLAFVGIFIFSVTNSAVVIYLFQEIGSQIESGTLGNALTLDIPDVPILLPSGASMTIASGTKYEILNQVVVFLIGLAFIRGITDFIRLFVMRYVSINIGRDIRSELYRDMIRRPVTFFEQKSVGDLISRLSNDIGQVKNSIGMGLRDAIQAPLEMIMAIGIAIYYAPILGIFYLILPLCGWGIYHVGNRIKRYSRATQDVMGSLLTRMQEKFTGIKLVKSEAKEDEEIEDFDEENQRHFRKARRKAASNSILRPALHFFTTLPMIAVLYFAISMIISGYLTMTQVATFGISTLWVYKSLRKISSFNETIQTSRGAAERIDQIVNNSEDVFADLEEGDRTPVFEDKIEFQDVGYSYPDYDEMALKNINLTFGSGENLALVGPSGAGKSTFTDLLLRFIDPTEGRIVMNGHELKEYDLKQYRQMFGLVTQHTILFDDTIRSNIRYGRPDVDEDDIRRAADQAEAIDFIESLPEGFETDVGEEGVKFSGGERQRLALARALLGDPRILVLDEATSDVDSRSEKMILKAIENLPSDISLVTISHALSTVQFADRIIVLNDHTIESIGEHSQLVESSPTYSQLYEHQVNEVKTAFN